MKWTPAQQKAITRRGGDLIVSAGPGAGKTAVLTQRCLERILHEKVPVDRLLVITFTENAAQELKLRIEQVLHNEFSEQKSAWGRTQLLLLRRSWISTIHSFCLRVLRENGMAAGLSPFARIQDAEESDLVNREMAEDVVRELLDRSPDVWKLVDDYADGAIPRFVKLVLSLSTLIDAVPDPDRWIDAQSASFAEGSFPEGRFLALIKEKGRNLEDAATENVSLLRSMGDAFVRYADYLEELSMSFGRTIREAASFDVMHRTLKDFPFGRLPPVKVEAEKNVEKKLAQKLVEEIRKEMKEKIIAELLAQTGEQYAEGEKKTAPYAAALFLFVKRFREKVREDKALREVLGFSDLEHRAFRLLSAGGDDGALENVAEKVRSRFTEVLVDEFQDVNALQDSLVSCVTTPAPGNLFIVGDLKQSIYRFRLGDPVIFAGKIRAAQAEDDSGGFVALQDNFRTRAPLLGLIDGMFSYLMTDALDGIGFDETSFCRPGRKEPVPDSSFGAPFMELHVLESDVRKWQEAADEEPADSFADFEKDEREAHLIARRLKTLKTGGLTLGEEKRPLAWSDCAILLRSVKHRMGTYLRILSEAGIPASGPDGEDPFESIEMRDLFSLIRVLDNPRQDIPLAALMHSPFGGFTFSELNALVRASEDAEGRTAPFHRVVLDEEWGEGSGDAAVREKAAQFAGRLSLWRRWGCERPLSEALWTIITGSGYFVYLASLPFGSRRKGNVLAFMDRARQFSSFERQGLFHFLRFLEDLRDQGGQLGAAVDEEGASQAVSICSIHKSKGLEWPVVVVPGLGRRFNTEELKQRVLMDREEGLGLRVVDREAGIHYPTARFLLLKARKEREMLAEELRILYVAFTRAREHLLLAGSGPVDQLQLWFEGTPGTEKTIPLHALLGARDPLGWICRAVARLEGAQADEAGADPRYTVEFHVTMPEVPRAAEESSEKTDDSELSLEEQEDVTSLENILSMEYAYREEAALRAVLPVTALKEHTGRFSAVSAVEVPTSGEELIPGAPERTQGMRRQRADETPVPLFLQQRTALSGTERGLLMHRFLQHMDLGAEDLDHAFDLLASRGVFTGAQKGSIDFAALSWFFETELGEKLKKQPSQVKREQSFLCRVGEPPSAVLLRGVIDGILFETSGVTVFDYKTDRINADQVEERARLYRPQLIAYSWALERIWKKQVRSACIVFFTPRIVYPVSSVTQHEVSLESMLKELVYDSKAGKPI